MSDQPGIFVGELPPEIVYGKCFLDVAYLSFDTEDDVDEYPEERRPSSMKLALTPNVSGPVVGGDYKIYTITSTVLTSASGHIEFWAIDGNRTDLSIQGWNWTAVLTVDGKILGTFSFSPDSTTSVPKNLGEDFPLGKSISGTLVTKGERGPAPSVTWDGSIIVVDGEVGPDLRGPQGIEGKGVKGDPGNDSTVPGPANTLVIGSVTSGPANAVITGVSPNQTLSLTIPPGAKGDTGLTGSESIWTKVGPGRPDVPSTTSGVITGSEASGTMFRSTDGASVGAWAWMKQGTKWVVTNGDTGWRYATLDSTVFAAGSYYAIRRVNERIHVKIALIFPTATTPSGRNMRSLFQVPDDKWCPGQGKQTFEWKPGFLSYRDIGPMISGSTANYGGPGMWGGKWGADVASSVPANYPLYYESSFIALDEGFPSTMAGAASPSFS